MNTKVSIDAAGLRVLHAHALRSGTLEQWSFIALDWADAAEKEITRIKSEGEQYRQNWLRLQDATGEQCLEEAIAKVSGGRSSA